jgi:hypothetical protein
MPSQTPTESYLTAVQHTLLSHILCVFRSTKYLATHAFFRESNRSRLAASEVKRYQSEVPKYVWKETSISFISPIFCPSLDIADHLEINRKPHLSCAVCGEAKAKLFFCSACSGTFICRITPTTHFNITTGIAYCSAEHQGADWTSSHRSECRVSNSAKHPRGHRADSADPSSPLIRVILPLPRTTEPDGPDITNFINPIDRLKLPSKSSNKSQCKKTIYGPGERFVVRARWGGHADRLYGVTQEDRLSGKRVIARDPEYQGALDNHMSCVLLFSESLTC